MNSHFSIHSGARVAEERKRLNLSQDDAGASCGVTRAMWSRYERGNAQMGIEVLAAFVGCGADALYILTGEQGGGMTQDERELLKLFPAAPLAVKAAAVGALQGGAAAQKKQTTKITAHGGNAAGRDIHIKTKERKDG